MRILTLGGYGVFGGRLVELLADLESVELLIAGRSQARADTFCANFTGPATVQPLAMDRSELKDRIAALNLDLVVDASGPFQDYGDAQYDIIRSCIVAGVNYMDLADSADFVFGVDQFDAQAREAGVYVLSGVSSFPVLTAAVLREMAKSMEIQTVTGGIAPSPYAGIGLNVMRAVLGYAGGPMKLTRDGRETIAMGLTESKRFTIAVPGKTPLRNKHFSLIDVPDLQVLPQEYPSITDIWMGAGSTPEVLHKALNVLAKARAALKLPPLTALAPLFHKVLNLMRFGEHRGGMFVQVIGRNHNTNAPTARSWHLLAEGDDGPYIPSMAIEAVIRKHIDGTRPAIGARAATSTLSLTVFQELFLRRAIFTGFRSPQSADTPLYRHVLGDAFGALSGLVQTLHDSNKTRVWRGTATVKRGSGILASALGWIFRFPPASEHVPVSVQFTPSDGQETWHRTFGNVSFQSVQWRGSGRHEHLLMERFGAITVALALVVKGKKLHLEPRSWSCLGLPLPRALLPKGGSFETETDGRFQFDVTIAAPVVGTIVAYRGTLEPSED